MDIDGLGPAIIDQLLENGLVSEPTDLYRLSEQDLLPLQRVGEQLAANLVAAIDRSRSKPWDRLLFGLGIRFVGSQVAAVIGAHFGSLRELAAATGEQLESIPGIGHRTAASIVDFFDRPQGQELVERLRELGVGSEAPGPAQRAGPLAQKRVVFTGTLPGISRAEAARLVEAAGGQVSSSVSGRVDLVVYGADPGSKLARARQLGLETVDVEGFLRLVGDFAP